MMRTEMSGLVRKSGLALMLLVALVSGAYSQSTLRPPTRSDFDGDGKSDLAVFRPSEGIWYVLLSSNNSMTAFNFGLNGDLIAPADYDGDRKTDYAVFRPTSGVWYMQQTQAGFRGQQFGSSIDLPVPGDYNNDQKDDIAIFRSSVNFLYVSPSPSGNSLYLPSFQPGDVPARMDYDHDGYRDGKFNRDTGKWVIGSLLVRTVTFGLGTDRLVPADYNGDNWEDIGVYRDGVWWFTTFRGNQAFAYARVEFGLPTDIPVPADYDGDLKADIAVFRPSSGEWFILESATNTIRWQNFGSNGDQPVQAAYLPPQ